VLKDTRFIKYSFEKKKWKFYAKVDDKIIPYLSKVSYLRRFSEQRLPIFTLCQMEHNVYREKGHFQERKRRFILYILL